MEKTHNELQKTWDTYANKALVEATDNFCSGHGLHFYMVPDDMRFFARHIQLLEALISPRRYGSCSIHRAFRAAAKEMAHFYEGYSAETLVLYKDSAFVCVRIADELMYVSVHPWDLPDVKAYARENNLFYDMRNVELLSLKAKNFESMKNVVVASF
jgi:hypothetical protein